MSLGNKTHKEGHPGERRKLEESLAVERQAILRLILLSVVRTSSFSSQSEM